MSVLDATWTASIDDFEFLVSRDETQGGRRQVEYEYIATNRRQVQDLGQYLKKFKIKGTVKYNPNVSKDYFNKRDQLISILESNKTHTLIHPFFGTVNVATGIYNIIQSFDKLGYADFSFEAIEVSNSINNSLPKANNQDTQTTIDSFWSEVNSNIAEFNSAVLEIDKKFKAAYQSVKDIYQNSLEQINNILSPIATLVDDGANFTKNIENDIETVNALISNPTALYTTLIDSLTGISSLTSDVSQALSTLKRFNEFGSFYNQFTSITTITDQYNLSIDNLSPNINIKENPITQQEIEIKNNAFSLINSVKQASLSTQYQLASQIDYDSTTQISEMQESLETQYQSIRDSFLNNTIDSMANLRASVNNVLQQKTLNTAEIKNITLYSDTPLSVLSYALYEDSSQSTTLENLNNIIDTIAVSGEIEVLTNARN